MKRFRVLPEPYWVCPPGSEYEFFLLCDRDGRDSKYPVPMHLIYRGLYVPPPSIYQDKIGDALRESSPTSSYSPFTIPLGEKPSESPPYHLGHHRIVVYPLDSLDLELSILAPLREAVDKNSHSPDGLASANV